MNEQEQMYFENVNKQLEMEQNKRMQNEINQSQASSFTAQQDLNLITEQLDLKEELDRIHHLLSGHIIKQLPDGSEKWGEPDDDRLKTLSDYGVKQIMNIVQFYVNKNTLLSNYDKDTILWKVKDFGNELNDLILTKYEDIFYYPKPEELYDTYLPFIGNFDIDKEELYAKCVRWSKEELQSRIRHYPLLVLSLVDTVHTTYLRALNGEERESLRKFMHVSQTANPQMQNPTKSFSLFKPSTWGK
jgi:hypothetical protein